LRSRLPLRVASRDCQCLLAEMRSVMELTILKVGLGCVSRLFLDALDLVDVHDLGPSFFLSRLALCSRFLILIEGVSLARVAIDLAVLIITLEKRLFQMPISSVTSAVLIVLESEGFLVRVCGS
jgi:hypothetical protein